MKIIHFIKSNSFSFILLALFSGYFAYNQLQNYIQHSDFVQKPAPEFVLHDVKGTPFELKKDSLQKKTLLVFWATWCGVCKAEMGDLINLENAIDKTRFQLISVVVPNNQSQADLQAFVKENDINYKVLVDTNGVYSQYNVKGFPTKYWIDADGVITDYNIGKNFGLLGRVKNWVDE